jgi:hypothetical protein
MNPDASDEEILEHQGTLQLDVRWLTVVRRFHPIIGREGP